MEISLGTPQEILEFLLGCAYSENNIKDDSLDFLNLDETTIYIVHVYPDGDVKIFERLETGTPLTFGDLDEDEDDPNDGGERWDPSSYVLPALYGPDKKGKERLWKIWAVKDTVYKAYGETGGILTPSSRTFKGLNTGKKNATTAEEQAKREAERDWVKQLDKDYHPKSEDGLILEKKVLAAKKKQGGVNVNIDALIRGRGAEADGNEEDQEEAESMDTPMDTSESWKDIHPMHCTVWSNEPKCMKYFDFDEGVYIQPKLDGVRCIAKIRNGRVVLSTCTGKDMVWLDHIRAEVKTLLSGKNEDLQLDGEIYSHQIFGVATYDEKKKKYSYGALGEEDDPDLELEMEQRFDVISGAARPKRNEPHPLESQLCLHVFDIADPTGELDQDDRFAILKELFLSPKAKKCPHIKRVETKIIYYPEEVEDYHDEVSEKDYEGVVMRARDLTYELRSKSRSLRMRKHKHFIDEEYPITDVACDEGVGRENFRWICEKIVESPETGENILTTFTVKPMGTREQRWNWYDNYEEYLGKLLMTRYQKLTYNGVPRFPRGFAIRDYDD